MNKVLSAYDVVIMTAHSIFKKEAHDYGASWRILRPIAILDQLYKKAKKIITIKETGVQKVTGVDNTIQNEFIGIINYGAMGCIQLEKLPVPKPDIGSDEAVELYENVLRQAQDDMQRRIGMKNEDDITGTFNVETLSAMIVQTVLYMKSSFNNKEEVIGGGSLKQNFLDIINYAIFALMIMNKESE